ncbi:LytTR family transcriptional regulator DNA-binding domain-containing protein [Sphingopyxis sp. BSN-002]|uniref:LytTR family DNA-binding domain-containing protein n=1 Tax=Sphingopyxis sp. BSN-002 TaxID=2911495 RepID=UPI001EDC754A|nr:LytTR family DNA-binding domain-containing protein [Sphingopyxis sp. BSN-002]UKK82961.1 LytTR family transcriptional regulator DNA-binding domain-containing protein [Sphingopyxis sp. BSN-002]
MAKRLTIELLAMVMLGLLIGLLGPFGTFDNPPAVRMLSWAIWLVAGYLFFRPTGVVAGWLCEATGLPRFAGRLIALAVASVPVTLIVIMMVGRMSFADALRSPGFWTMYLYICVISAVASISMAALFARGTPEDAPVAAEGPAEPVAEEGPPVEAAPALPLPPGFGPVRALKGEDHYVRVIGDGREELILMRMRDAIERLGPVEGLRIHRSWWVAKDAVAAVRREGRTAVVILTSGHEATVARDMMPQLRAAGWL